jgi:Domain of unknown function (DUF2760)
MSVETIPFAKRFFLAYAWFFRVLFDGAFAKRVERVLVLPQGSSAAGHSEVSAATRTQVAAAKPSSSVYQSSAPGPLTGSLDAQPKKRAASALQLLALFQREGRFIDFLQQDIAGHSDAEIGAAARLVHSGCTKALRRHVTIRAIHEGDEESTVEIPSDYNPSEISLTGRVSGDGPFRGTLKHQGWRVTRLELAETLEGHDANVLAPAEVEIA